MASALADEVAKMEAQYTELDPMIEGMHDVEHLHGAQEETIAEAQKAIRGYESRKTLLTTAIQANKALLANGWEEIPLFMVNQTVLDDITANQETIDLAKSQFQPKPPPAVTFEATVSPPEPRDKPTVSPRHRRT